MQTKRVNLNGLRALVNDQSGSIAIFAAVGLVLLLGFAALALDIGHLITVKSELQKAGDAGALACARGLNLNGPPYPNWTNGSTMGSTTVKENKAAQSQLTDCTVQTGYWDFTWIPSTPPPDLLSTGTTPSATQVPACKVTVSKSPSGTGNSNGGAVTMFFGKLLGISSESLSSSSVATLVLQSPVDAIGPGDAFPLAIPVGLVSHYWNSNPSFEFDIGSAYHYPTDYGDWTSFLSDSNNVPTIRSLIDSGNPGPLKIGDQIWIEPGTKTSLYAYAAEKIGCTVFLPVVGNDFDTNAATPILGFAPYQIDDAVGGSGKYIQGHFVGPYDPKYPIKMPGTTGSPNAPNYGALGYNAKLVN
jgi:Flp pilus assembly protein TadG